MESKAALLLVLALLAAGLCSGCDQFDRCSTCVYDAHDRINFKDYSGLCTWCSTTSKCVPAANATHCPDAVRTEKTKGGQSTVIGVCPDMTCGPLGRTNNIYFCDPVLIVLFVVSVFVLAFSLFYYLWVITVRQMPWRHANMHNAVDYYVKHSGSFLSNWTAPETEEANLGFSGVNVGSPCPMCRVFQQSTLGPGEVCAWCDIARVAFIPFSIGLTCSLVLITTTLILSIQPWFMYPYYALLLLFPIGTYGWFYWHVSSTRQPIVGDDSQRQSYYFQLAWILHGRSIDKVFHVVNEPQNFSLAEPTPRVLPAKPVEKPPAVEMSIPQMGTAQVSEGEPTPESTTESRMPEASPALLQQLSEKQPGQDPSPTFTSVLATDAGGSGEESPHRPNAGPMKNDSFRATVSVVSMKPAEVEGQTDEDKYRAETTRIVEIETKIPEDFRQKLRAELRADEFIVWYERPPPSLVAIDNRWLIHVFIALILFGIWLLLISSINQHFPLRDHVNPYNLQAAGLFMVVFFGTLLSFVINGCTRLYVLSNERTMVFARGALGSIHVTSTELSRVKCAAVLGYQEFGKAVMSFSWESPAGTRKMPPLQTNRFVGVQTMDILLIQFKEFSPPLDAALLKGSLNHVRAVWKLHITLYLAFLEVLVLIFYFRPAPAGLTAVGFVIVAHFALSIIQRGVRMQMLTRTSLRLSKEWSKWAKHRKFTFRKTTPAPKSPGAASESPEAKAAHRVDEEQFEQEFVMARQRSEKHMNPKVVIPRHPSPAPGRGGPSTPQVAKLAKAHK